MGSLGKDHCTMNDLTPIKTRSRGVVDRAKRRIEGLLLKHPAMTREQAVKNICDTMLREEGIDLAMRLRAFAIPQPESHASRERTELHSTPFDATKASPFDAVYPTPAGPEWATWVLSGGKVIMKWSGPTQRG